MKKKEMTSSFEKKKERKPSCQSLHFTYEKPQRSTNTLKLVN